ncbi:hypothetical protein ACFVAV_17550 [Nocardia sp. NPDC057663]|uniref:hypothetical protein n=1 Tax=Nocardia sp. NPDC057663 TaxID=3346201 RepID=UPI0036732BB0
MVEVGLGALVGEHHLGHPVLAVNPAEFDVVEHCGELGALDRRQSLALHRDTAQRAATVLVNRCRPHTSGDEPRSGVRVRAPPQCSPRAQE